MAVTKTLNKNKKNEILELLSQNKLKELFTQHLGWDNFNQTMPVQVEGTTYILKGVAEKAGFGIYELKNVSPDVIKSDLRKKISNKLANICHEHLIVFTEENEQIWQWIKRATPNSPAVTRSVNYNPAKQSGEELYQKLEKLFFGWDDYTITDVKQRVYDSFNKDKVTKKFYEEFKKNKENFSKFIEGMKETVDIEWYSSLMLNRLMFIYFIQKKGFLDNDTDYMRNKLNQVKEKNGDNRFYSFYREFLLILFYEGFAKELDKRSTSTMEIIGRIPYLNGGLFDIHELERKYPDIAIPDSAFEKIFDFFDKYDWHLDDRPVSDDKQINPDVIGHIFEKYINQKQMGAYYTKEDITEYISKNTIIPYLFEEAKKKCEVAFKENSYIWKLLKDNPDKYIYEAVKKGCDSDLPENIACGEDDVSKRGEWNKPATEKYALPTEIWRETVERRNRYFEIKSKLENGEISSINDFITYNLDIRQFIEDIITNAESPDIIKAFYYTIAGHVGEKSNEKDIPPMSILDPTCGSGAFLFSALNILELLYDACIDKMSDFKHEKPDSYKEFDSIIEDIEKHPNREYFIYKSIILNNLYGVDIMKEATEIAKLRLFLKLASCAEVNYNKENLGLEALPDIDFNIRAGNSLVGFANYEEVKDAVMFSCSSEPDSKQCALIFDDPMPRIDEEAQKVSLAYQRFKDVQKIDSSHDELIKAKQDLQTRLNALNDKLNNYMAKKYGKNIEEEYEQWLNSHNPFNWFVEFYDVIHKRGGFDVIIGNPPYVVYTKKDKITKKSIADEYQLMNYKAINANNLYVYTIERSLQILNSSKRFSMIVPLSLQCATNMEIIRQLLSEKISTYYSSYEIRPSKLFDEVDQRLTIFISHSSNNEEIYSTKINRWNNVNRSILFNILSYTKTINDCRIWRFDNKMDYNIYQKIKTHNAIRKYLAPSKYCLHYRSAGLRYWIIFLNNGFNTNSTSNKHKTFMTDDISKFFMAVLNSNIYWWFYSVNFDMFNLSDSNIFDFFCNYNESLNLNALAIELENDLNNNKQILVTNKKGGEINESFAFQKKKSKHIIDKIDEVLAKHYGFTDEELDYIINYDIKYRMGDSLSGDNDDE